MAMASSDSEPCTQRPPASGDHMPQPVERRGPAAGTSSEPEHQAPTAQAARPEPADKKKERAAVSVVEEVGGSGGELLLAARRPATVGAEESARERLKRHRTEIAGRVRVPDMWGQERLLKDWVDCAVFDRPLAATAGLLSARDALVAECATARRRAAHGSTGRPLRVQNGCS